MIFPVYNVKFEMGTRENLVVMSGDIRNDSLKDYREAIFRVHLYGRDSTLGMGVVKVIDFRKKTTKSFYTVLEVHKNLIPSIVRYELMLEGGY